MTRSISELCSFRRRIACKPQIYDIHVVIGTKLNDLIAAEGAGSRRLARFAHRVYLT